MELPAIYGCQQLTSENGDDGNNDEKLNEGEAVSTS
jgi:hypothetical protein